MPTTSPDGIYYADGSTPMSAEAISAAEATSVQNALDALVNDTRQIQTFVWANAAARTAQTGMIAGDFGFQTDTSTTYRYVNSAWAIFYPGAMVDAIPTSVAGTGVTLNTTTGLVTFTSTTALRLNGCFTSAFRNYRIVFDATGTAATAALNLGVAGVDSTTGYDITENLARNGVVSSSTALNATAWAITGATGGNTTHAGVIEVFVPAIARETRIISMVGSHANPAVSSVANALKIGYGTHRPTTAYDGFVLSFSAAQSGTVQVMGVN